MIDSPVTVPTALRKSVEVQQWFDSIGRLNYPTIPEAALGT
jgi:hypothetical protein